MGKAMRELVGEYVDYRLNRPGGSVSRSLNSVLFRFADTWDKSNRSPRSLDGVFVEDWIVDLRVSKATAGSYESYLWAFCEWAQRRGRITGDWQWDRVGDSSKRTRPALRLPTEFFITAYQGENWYWRGLFACMTWTLGRGIEVRNRRIADVRLGEGTIFWPRSKTGQFDDYLEMTEGLRVELERYLAEYRAFVGHQLDDSYYLFPAARTFYWGPAMKLDPEVQRGPVYEGVKRIIAKNIEPAMLKQNPDILRYEGGHTIRRSMARNTYEYLLGKDEADPLGIVQAWLGHKTRAMTERYIGLDANRQRRGAVIRKYSFLPDDAEVTQGKVVPLPNRAEVS